MYFKVEQFDEDCKVIWHVFDDINQIIVKLICIEPGQALTDHYLILSKNLYEDNGTWCKQAIITDKLGGIRIIVYDSSAYLCNDKGQTIENFSF